MGNQASRQYTSKQGSGLTRNGVPLGWDPRVFALTKIHGVPFSTEWIELYPPHLYTLEKAKEDIASWRHGRRPVHEIPPFHRLLRKGQSGMVDPRFYALQKVHKMRDHEIHDVMRNGHYTKTMALEDITRALQGKPPRHQMSRGIKFVNSKTGAKAKAGRPGYEWGYSHSAQSNHAFVPSQRPSAKSTSATTSAKYVPSTPALSSSAAASASASPAHHHTTPASATASASASPAHHHTSTPASAKASASSAKASASSAKASASSASSAHRTPKLNYVASVPSPASASARMNASHAGHTPARKSSSSNYPVHHKPAAIYDPSPSGGNISTKRRKNYATSTATSKSGKRRRQRERALLRAEGVLVPYVPQTKSTKSKKSKKLKMN